MTSVVFIYVNDTYKEVICNPGLLWAGSQRVESGHKIVKMFRYIAYDNNFYLNPN